MQVGIVALSVFGALSVWWLVFALIVLSGWRAAAARRRLDRSEKLCPRIEGRIVELRAMIAEVDRQVGFQQLRSLNE